MPERWHCKRILFMMLLLRFYYYRYFPIITITTTISIIFFIAILIIILIMAKQHSNLEPHNFLGMFMVGSYNVSTFLGCLRMPNISRLLLKECYMTLISVYSSGNYPRGTVLKI